ncbi:MAG: DUF4388 domain-containing protein [Candidatus Lernaella stagnicola]|nr:DUF4388 domain-containing protein [Candidatus Lernaella stagnicola]
MKQTRVVLLSSDVRVGAEMQHSLPEHFVFDHLVSAREFSDLVERRMPHVVVVSIVLPDANGLEFVRQLKQDPETSVITTIALSSFRRAAGYGDEIKAQYRLDGYLELPVHPNEWQTAIEAAMHRTAFAQGEADQAVRATAAELGLETPTHMTIPEAPPAEPEPAPEPKPERAPAAVTQPKANREPDEKGILGLILLPELLLKYYRSHANGLLDVRAMNERREILLRDGIPASIRTNFIADDALGQIIVSRGLIDPVALEKTLVEARESGRKIGSLLVEKGFLSNADLEALLRTQARRKINSAFRWREGSYSFTRGVQHIDDAVPIDQDMLAIIVTGIERHYDMAKLEERLYVNKGAIVEKVDFPELTRENLNLTEREWRVLELVDGETSLGEVIAKADLNFSRTFQVLYLFLLFGVIRFQGGDRFLRVDGAVANRAQAESGHRTVGKEQILDDEGDADVGNLSETPLGRYLFHLLQTQATGRLALRRGEHEELVFFKRGVPVKVTSSHPGPLALGELLIARGTLSPGQRDQALEKALGEGRQIGEVLVADQYVSPHELFKSLLSQLENKLLALFGWTEGGYEFEEGVEAEGDAPSAGIDVTRLIIQGMRQNVAAERVGEQVARYLDRAVRKSTDTDLCCFFSEPKEQRLVTLIDGRRTVRTLLEMVPLKRALALEVVYCLLQLELIGSRKS